MKEDTKATLARIRELQREIDRLEKEHAKLQKQYDIITAQREELYALIAKRKKPVDWAKAYGTPADKLAKKLKGE